MAKLKYFYASSRFKFLGLAFFIIFLGGCDADIFYKKITSIFNKGEEGVVYDAIAVWQNKEEGGNWEIAYSLYSQKDNRWFYLQDSQVYYERQANWIAKVPGDDQDPDIDTNGKQALAVWSNSGGDGNQGADIYFSFWNGGSWQAPARLFSLPGDDLDPTVYWQDNDSAMVVWVNRQGDNRALYFSEYNQGNWTNPSKISLPGKAEALAAPELGYFTTPQSRYLLVFTATINGKSQAYLGAYSSADGWQIEPVSGQTVSAIVDETIPSPYQNTTAMHISSRQVIVAWPAQDGSIWYARADSANRTFSAQKLASGTNPYLQFGFGSFAVDTILWQQGKQIVNLTPVEPGSYQQVVSPAEPQRVRLVATYLLYYDDKAMVAVWHTDNETPSEIYFSAVEIGSQNWTTPASIDVDLFPGEDRNPAIAPLHIRWANDKFTEVQEMGAVDDDEWCGDKILQAGEDCEIGIACKDKSKQCDFDLLVKNFGPIGVLFGECECIPPDDLPPQGDDEGDNSDGDDWWPGGKEEEISDSLGGAACGFNQVKIVDDTEDDSLLKFLPETSPANGEVRLGDSDTPFSGVFQEEFTTRMRLFPLSDPPHPLYLVKLKVTRSDGDLIESWPEIKEIEMRGFQELDNGGLFQLCVGKFKRGEKPEEGGFIPAPAPAGSGAGSMVPELPAN